MKRLFHQITAIIIALICFTSCGDNSFKISGTLEDAGTQNLHAMYLYGDTIVSQWMPAMNGEFSIEGKADKLTVVYLYSAQMQLIAHVAVEGGDEIAIKGKLSDPYNLTITGTDINERWMEFIRKYAADFRQLNTTKTDKAIADYVKTHPDDVVSTLLLACDYSDPTSTAAQKLLTSIHAEAKPQQLTSLYGNMTIEKSSTAKRITSLKLRNEADSLEIVKTTDKAHSIFYFWNKGSVYERKKVVDALKHLAHNDLQIVDVCLDCDTLGWHRMVSADSVKWKHFKAIGGPVDRTVMDFNIKSSPYFVVVDSLGKCLYSGASMEKAQSVVKKKK